MTERPPAAETLVDPDPLVERCLRTLAPQLATVEANPRATLRRDSLGTLQEARAAGVVDSLRALQSIPPGSPERPNAVELRSQLGEGGMGVVALGRQVSMDRLVAVKMTKRNRAERPRVLRLVHEALVTGSLEHPNVVPIYDVQMDAEGAPQIVMHRVEGDSWRGVLEGDPEGLGPGPTDDAIEWHLRTLLSVCDALSLAHSQGYAHRDIKPENVMLGRFGEVYLLDWGLAVPLGERDESAKGPVGTPAFMAPEMLTQAEVTERTDVYLLGATLFSVVAGHPPHDTSSPIAVITSVLNRAPDYPESMPAGVRAICERALAKDAAARYPDVASFKAAVARYLRRRGAEQLAQKATETAERLEAGEAANRTQRYELFGECRFGLRESLRQFPDNPAALTALERATAFMVRRELAEGDVRAASLLLSEMDAPPEDLRADLAAAEDDAEEERARQARLEALGRSLDRSVGQTTRVWFSITLGAMWTLFPLISGIRVHVLGREMTYQQILTFPVMMAAAIVGVAYFGREHLMSTTINRRMVGVLLATMAAMELCHAGLVVRGIPVADIQLVDNLLFVGMGAAWASFIDVRLTPCVLFFTGSFLYGAFHPDQRFFSLAVGNFLCLLNMLWAWLPRRDRDEGDGPDAPAPG